jgi:hypothetical protein
MMLDAHADLAVPPETQFIPSAAKAWEGSSGALSVVLADMTAHRCWGDLEVDARELENRLSASRPENFGDVLRMLFRIHAEQEGKSRWGDKSSNYTQQLGLIADVLPEAHFVHIIRDGRDVFLSLRDLWFGPDTAENAARWWRWNIQQARKSSPPRYMEIRYEDLVIAPDETLRSICAFIDLPWDARMLRYYERAARRIEPVRRDVWVDGQLIKGDRRAALAMPTTRPLDASRIHHWRTDMPDDEKSVFAAVAGELLSDLGYPRD